MELSQPVLRGHLFYISATILLFGSRLTGESYNKKLIFSVLE